MNRARTESPNPEAETPFTEMPRPIRFDARDVDLAADPRIDLDAFVNARWRAANPVPRDRSCWDAFAILTERTQRIEAAIASEAARVDAPAGSSERIVGDFWRSGMEAPEHAGLDLLAEELARIDRLDTPAAIAAYIRDRHARGIGVVFRLDVEPDFAAPEQTIAYVAQAGLGLPDRDDYFDATQRGIARRREYAAHVTAMLELAGCDNAAALADDLLAFETGLAAASMSRVALARDVGARFRPVDIDDADRASPNFPWTLFFGALGIETPRRFSRAMPEFFAAFGKALRTAPANVWRAYLRYHTVDDAAPFLGEGFAAAHHRFHGEFLRGRKTPVPRWKRVVAAIDACAGEAMGRLYVARCFDSASRQRIVAMAGSLRAALRARLENAAWMGEATRHAALAKLDALRVKIGYPERWRDWSGLVTSRASLYANVLAARRFERERDVARIGGATDRSRWPMPPQSVNAGYDPHRNEIVFPAAILAPPFFDPAADAPLNYGGIGAVIAHEMTHAFDDQGSRFDAGGRFDNWWTPEDRVRFDALTARMIAHFERWPAADGAPIDGRRTLGENVADFAGLAVACDALRASSGGDDPMLDGYTRLQRFFLAWAVIWRQSLTLGEASFRLDHDAHAPAGVRANAASANHPAYAEAFGCRSGDPMYVDAGDRVGVW